MYRCIHCGKSHADIPAFHADRPAPYWDVPAERRERDVRLTSDSCVIADRFFFVHGRLEIPIHNEAEPFTWGVWVSLSKENFVIWQEHYAVRQRSHLGPFFGWLCTRLPLYPETQHLKTLVHLRDDGQRPTIELEATAHPLSQEQQHGISLNRALEMVHLLQERELNG